jgi:acyl dehydratase
MPNTVTLEELREYEGRDLAPSDWIEVTQDRIDRFADCTDDHQFIHVDPEAAKSTPWGTTIAHGFLSLSLIAGHSPKDWPQLENAVMGINYGLDKVRFLAPVKVGGRVRIHTKILSVRQRQAGRVLIKSQKTMEIEGESKPAFIAETLGLTVAA